MRERVKLNLEIDDREVDDAEPVALDPLAAAGLRQRLFDSADKIEASAIDLDPSPLERARGTLPPAPLAAPNYAAEAEAVNALLPVWQAWKAEGAPDTVNIRIDDIAGVRLTGRVDQLWPGALRRLRTGKLKTRFRLRYWVDYLAVTAAGHDAALEVAGFSPEPKDMSLTQYAGRLDADAARDELARLVRLYIDGQQAPLLYHPDLDDSYDPDQNKAFDNLSFRFKPAAWHPHYLTRDPYFRLLLGDDETPLGDSEENQPLHRRDRAGHRPDESSRAARRDIRRKR